MAAGLWQASPAGEIGRGTANRLHAARVAVIDDIVRIPPAQWRLVDLLLRQQAATVELSYMVVNGHSGVRAALMERSQVDRMRAGRSYTTLAGTAYNPAFTFRAAVPRPGDYAIVIDNRMEGRETAEVHLQVSLLFDRAAAAGGWQVREASTVRRAVVIVLSLAFFSAVCAYAWIRLGPALRG